MCDRTGIEGDHQTIHVGKDGRAALLHILVAAKTEKFGLKKVTLVIKQLTSQVYVGKTDSAKIFDDIKEKWIRCNITITITRKSMSPLEVMHWWYKPWMAL